MPVPLVWLGLGAAACIAGYRYTRPEYGDESVQLSEPQIPNGAVAYCGIYGVFEHSGVWLDGRIIERHGSGLVKVVSPERFLSERSGRRIRIACDEGAEPLGCEAVAIAAAERLYQYDPYHVLERNCHHFVSECLGHDDRLTLFSELTAQIKSYYQSDTVRWYELTLGESNGL